MSYKSIITLGLVLIVVWLAFHLATQGTGGITPCPGCSSGS
jgi:hypothetical protein